MGFEQVGVRAAYYQALVAARCGGAAALLLPDLR